jgi:hypothetical protein
MGEDQARARRTVPPLAWQKYACTTGDLARPKQILWEIGGAPSAPQQHSHER